MSAVTPLSQSLHLLSHEAAVHNLSKNLAREWAPNKIRVNLLVPGFFPAEQNRKVLTEERVAQIMNHTPMKRFGEASELIGATLLLASNEASGFITGTELIVGRGLRLHDDLVDRPKVAIPGIPQTGHDVGLIVKLWIDGGREYINVRMCRMKSLDPRGTADQVEETNGPCTPLF